MRDRTDIEKLRIVHWPKPFADVFELCRKQAGHRSARLPRARNACVELAKASITRRVPDLTSRDS